MFTDTVNITVFVRFKNGFYAVVRCCLNITLKRPKVPLTEMGTCERVFISIGFQCWSILSSLHTIVPKNRTHFWTSYIFKSAEFKINNCFIPTPILSTGDISSYEKFWIHPSLSQHKLTSIPVGCVLTTAVASTPGLGVYSTHSPPYTLLPERTWYQGYPTSPKGPGIRNTLTPPPRGQDL